MILKTGNRKTSVSRETVRKIIREMKEKKPISNKTIEKIAESLLSTKLPFKSSSELNKKQ